MGFLFTIGGLLLLLVFGGTIISLIQISQIRGLKEDLLRLQRELRALTRQDPATPTTAPSSPDAEPQDNVTSPPASEAELQTAAPSDNVAGEITSQTEAEAIAARLNEIDESVAASSAPPTAVPAMAKPGFEERLGSQLTVWIGGLALALGGIFLVKYTIDAGLLGPGARIFLGALLALVLGGLGEFTRRADIVEQIRSRGPDQLAQHLSGLSNAYVPGILTAAGLITAFATAYAAYALYGFIGGFFAFVLLAAISAAGLAVSVLHGPWLAVIGLVGGYVTPMLISSDNPSAWTLFSYLLVLTAAVYLTAWMRGWLGLAQLACGASVAWGLLWLLTTYKVPDGLPLGLYVIGLVVTGLVFLRNDAETPDANQAATTTWWHRFDWPLVLILCGNMALWLVYVVTEGHGQLSVLVTGILVAVFLASATRWETLLPLAVLASGVGSLLLITWPNVQFWSILDFDPYGIITSGGARRLAIVASLFAGAVAGIGLWHTFTRRPHMIWGGIATAFPVFAFIYTYLRVTEFDKSVPFAIAGLALGGAYGVLAERLDRVDEYANVAEPGRAWTVGALAAAASAFIALALTINFEQGWLTIGLAAMAPALAWISTQRPIPILRWIVAVLAGIVVARLLWDPRIVGDAISTTPIFNWILYGYGLPTLAFGAAAHILGKEEDLPAQITRGAAMAFLLAFVGMEIRHLMNGGDVFSSAFGLAELATHTISWLGFSLGLRWWSGRRHDGLMLQVANLVGLLGFASIALGHLVIHHPMATQAVLAGGTVFNTLLLAYAIPAVLCGLLVWQVMGRLQDLPEPVITGLPWTPRSFADTFGLVAGALALVLAFVYLTLEVSRVFQGPILQFKPSDGELYTWSAVWIGFAMALLYFGITLPSVQLRQAGFAVLLIATLKIFLIDMSALTGLLRAVSFIGLGAVLVGIGYAYQKLMLGGAGGTPSDEPDEKVATET